MREKSRRRSLSTLCLCLCTIELQVSFRYRYRPKKWQQIWYENCRISVGLNALYSENSLGYMCSVTGFLQLYILSLSICLFISCCVCLFVFFFCGLRIKRYTVTPSVIQVLTFVFDFGSVCVNVNYTNVVLRICQWD